MMFPDIDPNNTDYYWRVNELKNMLYCPRISFYTLCLGIDRETGHSKVGIQAEAETKRKMRRRKHALHAVVEGERHFDVAVVNHELRLVGKLDEVVVTSDGLYLVDYKDTDKDYGYWRVQMTAYRLCLHSMIDLPILDAFVYAIPSQQYIQVKSTRRDEKKLNNLLDVLGTMVNTEQCPPPTAKQGKCRSCQYQRFCNDIF